MIHRIVQAALRQRFLVLMLTAFITVGGILSFQRMPVDAYPDLSPPQVEIITQWPDHAAEEVERLVTLPLELEMNGVPHMVVMRSISLYGLSDLILTFEDSTDDYFARQIVFERLAQATVPTGVIPTHRAPIQSERPGLSLRARESRSLAARIEDDRGLGGRARLSLGSWSSRRLRFWRHGHAVSGAARSGAHLWISPDDPASGDGALARTTPMPAADFIRRVASSITCAASALCATRMTSETSSWARTRACPSACATSAKSPSATRRVSANSATRKMTMRSKASF